MDRTHDTGEAVAGVESLQSVELSGSKTSWTVAVCLWAGRIARIAKGPRQAG